MASIPPGALPSLSSSQNLEWKLFQSPAASFPFRLGRTSSCWPSAVPSSRRIEGFRCYAAAGAGFFTRLGRLIKEKAKSDVEKVFTGFSKTRNNLAVIDELLLYWNLADTDRVLDELEEVCPLLLTWLAIKASCSSFIGFFLPPPFSLLLRFTNLPNACSWFVIGIAGFRFRAENLDQNSRWSAGGHIIGEAEVRKRD